MAARRLKNVPESGTVKIANIVSKLRHEGADIVSFSMGEPDFPTPDNITQACVASLNDHFTHYTPSAGIPELRKAVAAKAREINGIPCTDANVLITPTKQAIFMAALAMIDEGDEVILPDPTWGTYEACVRLVGGVPKLVTLDESTEFRMTPEKVSEAISSRTRMIFINSPANPTGSVLTEADVEGIADLAVDRDLWVLSDEVYERVVFEGKHVSIASLPGMFDRTITVNGVSKTYAMTGWRLGWAIAPTPIFKALNTLQTHSITCCTSFVQKAGVEALNGPQDSVDRMVQEFKARRDLIMDLMDEIPTLNCPEPKGAFYLFPSYDQSISSEDMAAYLLEKAHVAVTPGSAFGPAGEKHIRISYACSRQDIVEGMGRIKEALAKL
ncbi:pyridoxal phosphate-dependent aminotransferase [Methanomassiliicoccus luminyensis]|uniref:pyridoxal phosphate-dependent aminotransferase n=1 Tax=Methanomassiliicoccus luminyensis TaxID=1080712 RepID=UPI0003788623|nr:pyridoxal phosphate-dependent aminotransferase [Methanomassiliicoccus luminyensis]